MLATFVLLLALSGPADSIAPEDRSGPTRPARCEIDGKPARPCQFTPLFGDGSFDILLADRQQYRVVIDGEHASVFVVMGPQKRVPLTWPYHRDAVRRACWVTDADDSPQSICVY
jgi:hypothetical protein